MRNILATYPVDHHQVFEPENGFFKLKYPRVYKQVFESPMLLPSLNEAGLRGHLGHSRRTFRQGEQGLRMGSYGKRCIQDRRLYMATLNGTEGQVLTTREYESVSETTPSLEEEEDVEAVSRKQLVNRRKQWHSQKCRVKDCNKSAQSGKKVLYFIDNNYGLYHALVLSYRLFLNNNSAYPMEVERSAVSLIVVKLLNLEVGWSIYSLSIEIKRLRLVSYLYRKMQTPWRWISMYFPELWKTKSI